MNYHFFRRIISAVILGFPLLVQACPACEKAQPRIFRGLTHGGGPDSSWDYLIVFTAVIITLLTLFFSIKWLIRPGERANNHIKRFILNND